MKSPMKSIIRNFVVNIIERKADKFLVGTIGSAVTWATATFGAPVGAWLPAEWVSATAAGLTAAAVYLVRNAGT